MSWNNTSTSSSTYYTVSDNALAEKYVEEYYETKDQKTKCKEPEKSKYCSEPLSRIVAANIISGNMSLFAHRKSPVFKDRDLLRRENISAYFNDPIVPEYATPTALFSYNFSVIIDALEYMPGKMAKANLIKEALSTLNPKKSSPCVIILAKTRKMIEELAKNNKYEELRDGFLITNGPFRESIAQGLDTEDILELAHFARAKYMEEDTLVKTDLTCVKIYLHKQV